MFFNLAKWKNKGGDWNDLMAFTDKWNGSFRADDGITWIHEEDLAVAPIGLIHEEFVRNCGKWQWDKERKEWRWKEARGDIVLCHFASSDVIAAWFYTNHATAIGAKWLWIVFLGEIHNIIS